MPAHPIISRQTGRGAKSNTGSRFFDRDTEPVDDGWTDMDAPPEKLKTRLIRDTSKTIITHNDSPDISFDASINPYRGCEHGCIYCYARPSHAYWGYSPGLDFESQIFVKPQAAELLDKTFRHKNYQVKPIMVGANTDCYQPTEKSLRITREILKTCLRFKHPVSLITKSALVVRDLDVLGELASLGLTRVAISLTTLDRKLSRAMEPRAATPERRLQAMRALTGAGISVTVMTAPIIPALNDFELEKLLAAAKGAGASGAGYVLLRLPHEIKDLFREWLEAERPNSAKRVMSLMQQMRGGKDYDSRWGIRQRGTGPYAEQIAARFRAATRRLGLDAPRPKLRQDLFERPLGDKTQMSLF